MKLPYLFVALVAGGSLLHSCALIEQPLSARSSQTLAIDQPQAGQPLTDMEKLVEARRLAWDAAVMVQTPPHPVDVWQRARVKWRSAIRLLESISEESSTATQVQEKLISYRENYAAIDARLKAEQTGENNLKASQTLAWQAAVTVQEPPHPLKVWQRASSKWQEAIALLEEVPNTATTYRKSQEKLATYRNNLVAINQQITTETQALVTLRQFSETIARLNSIPGHAASSPTGDNIGLSYAEYTALIKNLETSLHDLTSQPQGNKHLVYAELEETIADLKQVTDLWQTYSEYKKTNSQWLYGDLFNQLMPLPFAEMNTLVQKYGIKTYSDGTKISLRFSAWEIWYHASQRVRQTQQKVLSQKDEG
jgi:hypothetical protein